MLNVYANIYKNVLTFSLQQAHLYNASSDQWTQVASSLVQRRAPNLVNVNGRIFLLGDYTLNTNVATTVIEEYLPKQMTDAEILENAKVVIAQVNVVPNMPVQALAGKSMGEFNKRFPGMADPKKVKEIIENLLK